MSDRERRCKHCGKKLVTKREQSSGVCKKHMHKDHWPATAVPEDPA